MPRRPDPTRKPELLGQILEHLRERSIATVSFRTLAEALGVSTYVFVYHFGNRAQLVAEIVRGVVARHDAFFAVDAAGLDEAGFVAHLGGAWADSSSPRGRDMQRLELEAALLEVVAGDAEGPARQDVVRWHRFVAGWLTARGVPTAVAKQEARIFVDAVRGMQYDVVVTADVRRVTTAFKAHLESFVGRVPGLVGA